MNYKLTLLTSISLTFSLAATNSVVCPDSDFFDTEDEIDVFKKCYTEIYDVMYKKVVDPERVVFGSMDTFFQVDKTLEDSYGWKMVYPQASTLGSINYLGKEATLETFFWVETLTKKPESGVSNADNVASLNVLMRIILIAAAYGVNASQTANYALFKAQGMDEFHSEELEGYPINFPLASALSKGRGISFVFPGNKPIMPEILSGYPFQVKMKNFEENTDFTVYNFYGIHYCAEVDKPSINSLSSFQHTHIKNEQDMVYVKAVYGGAGHCLASENCITKNTSIIKGIVRLNSNLRYILNDKSSQSMAEVLNFNFLRAFYLLNNEIEASYFAENKDNITPLLTKNWSGIEVEYPSVYKVPNGLGGMAVKVLEDLSNVQKFMNVADAIIKNQQGGSPDLKLKRQIFELLIAETQEYRLSIINEWIATMAKDTPISLVDNNLTKPLKPLQRDASQEDNYEDEVEADINICSTTSEYYSANCQDYIKEVQNVMYMLLETLAKSEFSFLKDIDFIKIDLSNTCILAKAGYDFPDVLNLNRTYSLSSKPVPLDEMKSTLNVSESSMLQSLEKAITQVEDFLEVWIFDLETNPALFSNMDGVKKYLQRLGKAAQLDLLAKLHLKLNPGLKESEKFATFAEIVQEMKKKILSGSFSSAPTPRIVDISRYPEPEYIKFIEKFANCSPSTDLINFI